MRPTTEEILMMARTQEAAKADRPALRAKPTTCTRGIEWQIQQKRLMNDSDQKPSMRKTSPHNDPPDRADFDALCAVGRGDGTTGVGFLPYGSRPISCG